MTLEQELQLSYYKKVSQVNEAHNVCLVQDVRTGEFLIRKTLTVFHPAVYRYLMEHPVKHTPQLRELIEADGKLHVIEEYIPGKTLDEVLRTAGPLPEASVRDIAVQLCGILRCFHRLPTPIVNRDLKPENLKYTDDGVLKLLDLNAARPCREAAEADTVLLGTAGYAAPEQYGFGQSDPRTDIYAAGRLFQVLLTGSLEKPVPPDSFFSLIIKKCTEIDPENRFQTVDDLENALQKSRKRSAIRLHQNEGFLPGFRSANPLLWLLSALGYYLLFSAALTLEHPVLTGARLLLYRGMTAAGVLLILLLTGNFRNIQPRLLGDCRKLPVRIAKVLAADAVIFGVLVWLVTLL